MWVGLSSVLQCNADFVHSYSSMTSLVIWLSTFWEKFLSGLRVVNCPPSRYLGFYHCKMHNTSSTVPSVSIRIQTISTRPTLFMECLPLQLQVSSPMRAYRCSEWFFIFILSGLKSKILKPFSFFSGQFLLS